MNSGNVILTKVIMKIVITLLLLNVFSFAASRVSLNHQAMFSSRSVLVGPNTPIYLLRTEDSELMVEKKINIFNHIPFRVEYDTLFIEVLVFIDYDMTIMEEYDTEEKIIEHVLTMWDRVDETYQHLKKTNIKINLAGIVIPKDSGVFNFFYKHDIDRLTVPAINYVKVMDDMGRWLYNHTDIFPSDSYDAFMISTDSPDVDHGIGNLVGGTAMTYGACRTERYRRMTSRGGIIYDVDDFSYRHAVHELAHLIGIDHDQDTQCSNDTNTVMQAHNDGCTTTWSSCSENSFLERYGKNWFPCLANIPKHFSLIIV